jgi:hypothetical protein
VLILLSHWMLKMLSVFKYSEACLTLDATNQTTVGR